MTLAVLPVCRSVPRSVVGRLARMGELDTQDDSIARRTERHYLRKLGFARSLGKVECVLPAQFLRTAACHRLNLLSPSVALAFPPTAPSRAAVHLNSANAHCRAKRYLAKYGMGAVPLPEELTCPDVFGFRGIDGLDALASDDMHIVKEGVGIHIYKGIYDNFDSACRAKVSLFLAIRASGGPARQRCSDRRR